MSKPEVPEQKKQRKYANKNCRVAEPIERLKAVEMLRTPGLDSPPDDQILFDPARDENTAEMSKNIQIQCNPHVNKYRCTRERQSQRLGCVILLLCIACDIREPEQMLNSRRGERSRRDLPSQ